MDKRSLKIENGLKEAEEKRKEAAEDRAKAALELEKAKKEAYELIQKMRFQGAELKEEVVNEAKAQAKDLLARAKDDIALEVNKAKGELREQVASLSLMVAEKLLQREIKAEDQEQLVDECLNGLTRRD